NIEAKASELPSPAPKAADEVVDLSHLELFTDGDPEQEALIVTAFLSSAETSIGILKAVLDGKLSNEEWRQIAHKIKGSSAQIGANGLADLCRRAEGMTA